jgi:hypothetical protein
MNRERAKELLPIIQAYAEGKTIQYKVGDEWYDLSDPNFEGFDTKLYRVKPSEKYNEIFKLKSLLEENHIPFEWIEHNEVYKQGYQICYPGKGEKSVCSVIEHSFSYGSQKDLLEIQGLLTEKEEECDSVVGDLTADNVFQRILSHWEKIKENAKTVYRPFKSCNELVYYWEREKVGYSVNPLVMTDVWVKHKVDGRRRMIVGFGDNFVEVGNKTKPITLERLFEIYTFLDESPCGVCE